MASNAPSPQHVATLLETMGLRDRAEDRMFEATYRELRALAAYIMESETNDSTLQPTALVNEAYIRLTRGDPMTWTDHRHFINTAARAMRQVLVDMARRRSARKRGGDRQRVSYDDIKPGSASELPDDQVAALEHALKRLEEEHPRAAEVAHLRFFAGLSSAQTSALLGIAVPTVRKDWKLARIWLASRLENPAES